MQERLGVLGCYSWLQEAEGLQGVTRVYRELQRVGRRLRGCKGLQAVATGLKEVSRGYRGLVLGFRI